MNKDPFLEEALLMARKSYEEGGIPIGSVLVRNGEIIGRGHNQRVQKGDPILHAEMDCLRNAGRQQSYKDCILYSTLMPCFMCAGTAVQFKIPKIVVGENRNFSGSESFLQEQGVEVEIRDDESCYRLMKNWMEEHPELWSEDIAEES